MAGVAATFPRLYFTDANGAPLAGGKLYSYLAGTTTNTPTWVDESLQTFNSNPIILDSVGSCLCWLDSSVQYKFVLTNATDVLVWSQDNITGVGPSSSVSLSTAVLAVYQGAFATDPTTRVGGTALQNGDMYFNTSLNRMKAYANGVWYTTDTLGATDAALVSYTPGGTGAVATSVQAKLRETVSVKDFGAVGDDAADDTTAFVNAFATGRTVRVPKGTYLIDQITVTSKLNLVIDDEAVIKQRSPGATGLGGLIKISGSGANGSSITGGIFDGNRSVVGPSHSSPDDGWNGVLVLYANNVRISNITFRNFVTAGFWLQGDYLQVSDIIVESCGKGSLLQYVNNGQFVNIQHNNIGADGLQVYEHCTEWRQSTNLVFDNITIKNFNPTTAGNEPNPEAISFESSTNVTLNNVIIDGFIGQTISGQTIGFYDDTVQNLAVSNLVISGYTRGMMLNTCDDVSINNSVIDGKYVANLDAGIYLNNSGLVPETDTGIVSFNARAVSTCRNVSVNNTTIRRFNVGIQAMADGLMVNNCHIYGCLTYGIQVQTVDFNAQFAEYPQGTYSTRISNSSIKYNGYSAIHAYYWREIFVDSCDLRDNGQNSSVDAFLRCGVTTVVNTTAMGTQHITNCQMGDSQSWTSTQGLSFIPGATDADNRKTMSMINPERLNVGQYIKLVNATGSGDAIAKVYNIKNDAITLQCSAPTTFSDTGNLVSLTGTISASGQIVTGIGTAFIAEVRGPAYLKVGAEYRLIQKINSNTSLQISQAFVNPVSGASASIVVIEVQGIPSQQHGYRNVNLMTNLVYTKNNNYDGVVIQPMNLGTFDCFGNGAEVIQSTNRNFPNGILLSTVSDTTDLIPGLPAGYTPIAARVRYVSAVTGTDGTLNFKFTDGTGDVANVFSSNTYAQDTKLKGDAISPFPFRSSGNLAVKISSGSDNIASGGAIAAEVTVKAPTYFYDMN